MGEIKTNNFSKLNNIFEKFENSSIGKFLIEKVFFRKKTFNSILYTFGLILVAQLSAYGNIMHWADKVDTQLSHSDGWVYVGWFLLSLIVPEGNLFLIIVLFLIIIGAWVIRYRELKQIDIEKKQFKPTLDWVKEKIELSLESIGNRYITYNQSEYKSLNIKINLHDLLEAISNTKEFDITYFYKKLKHDSGFLDGWNYAYAEDSVNYYYQKYKDDTKYIVEIKDKKKSFKSFYLNNSEEDEIIVFTYSNLSTIIGIILDYYVEYNNLLKQFKDIELFKENFFSIKTTETIKRIYILYNEILSHKDTKLVEEYCTSMVSPYSVEKIGKILKRMKNIQAYILEFKKIIFKNIYTDLPRLNSNNDLLTYLFKYSVLSGEAMSGKTHLLSDIANKRIHNNKPTILIYAQKFEGYCTPIQHIVKQLNLEQYQYTDEEFLGIINDWGKKSNELVFLIVDAINETPDKKVWRNNFIEFVSMVKKYRYIALIMSIRDVEKRVIFTKDIKNHVQSNMIEIKHVGFKEIEYPVLKKFCEVFDVNLPKFPLTSPIFVNPGLMFLFFETLQRNHIVEIDEQVLKPNFIIEEYIKDRNRHFKEMNQIVNRGTYIHQGTNIIASKMAPMNFIEKVKYDDIHNDVAIIHHKLLEYLISEGILLEQLSSLDEVYLYFSYQRFGNYFIALYLLTVDFEKNKNIIFNILNNYVEHQPLVEALIIRFSENEGKDFIDIFPDLFENEELNSIRYQCFSKSLRLPKNIETKITNFITLDLYEKYEVLELLLSFIYEKKNKLNIEKMLHPLLLSLSMPERDYHWSIYLHHSFSDDGIVRHIISWAWEKEEEYEIEDESLYLYGLTLGWFLTSSNRELRDGATKALVNLFTDRVDVFLKVLNEFETVDDLYVLERLYAVGYGIVLRSSKHDGYKELGQYLYETIFNQSEVIEHSFIRDYTRLTIEFISRKYQLEIDTSKIEPPYNQHKDWDIASIEEDDFEYSVDDYRSIEASALDGDFKIYVVYPLLNHFMNLKIKDRPHPKMPRIRYDEFFEALTEEQEEEYKKTKLESHQILSILQETDKDQIAVDDILTEIKGEQLTFRNMLSDEQCKEYDDFIVTYKQAGRYENGINVKNVKWLIFVEAIKLGWDKELFEEFDKNANNGRGRETGTERIGKKYQWIALYKVLSRLADNYEFREDGHGEKITGYKGMYQFSYNRDIDPSTILKSKEDTEDEQYFGIDTVFENLELADKEWMNSTDKLPTLNQLVNIQNNGRESLTLHLSFFKDGTKTENNYRNLYYNIDAFVIKKDCIKSFIEWLGTVNYYGQRKLPQASSLHNIYLREYPNSEAFSHSDIPYYGQVDWDNSFGHIGEAMPCEILLTSTSYMNEGQSYDKSVEETIEVSLPHKWFVNEMDLKQTLVDGEWVNGQGEIVFFDSSVKTGNLSPYNKNGTLVADKKLLLKFLEVNGYSLVWVMWGEKQVRNSGDGFNNKEFLGIAKISGYGYFEGDEFIEDMNINFKERE